MAGPRMFTVGEQVEETPSIRTVMFREGLDASPGQFVMVWVPGVDEFPMSVSFPGKRFGITYQIVGQGTKALASSRPGERIGIRGPYGNGYLLGGDRVLVVAGGTGMASLAPLVEAAVAAGRSVDLVLGAKNRSELLFERRSGGTTIHISTDDGSKGFKGLATELARKVAQEKRFDHVYACGPERMVVGVMRLAEEHQMPMHASLERLMKCGIGVCDSCAVDGLHVCRDGPVFELAQLRGMAELGKTKLDTSGKRVPI